MNGDYFLPFISIPGTILNPMLSYDDSGLSSPPVGR